VSPRPLEDQVALITGGGSGLGRALVARFLEEGCLGVGILEKSPDKIAELHRSFGDRVVLIEGDVRSFEDNRRAVAATVSQFGKLDCFVGNAALWDHNASLLTTSGEQLNEGFDELLGVNLKGYLLGAKAASEELIRSEGCMIFTLSNAAFYTGGGGPLYTSSKHGGVGLVRQLAYELAPRVRVNAVAPSGMATDMRGPGSMGLGESKVTDTRSAEQLGSVTPLQILAVPEAFTGSYVLLASRRDNVVLTGVLINADGGLGIRGIRYSSGSGRG